MNKKIYEQELQSKEDYLKTLKEMLSIKLRRGSVSHKNIVACKNKLKKSRLIRRST